jgi:hypothetical protein
MMKSVSSILLVATMTAGAYGHGAMVFPAPRSAHNQTYDEGNTCDSANPYSTAGSVGEYCGVGCLGDACLYYQIGCYAGCPTCSLVGKDLYPTAADLAIAGNCTPIAPTLGGGDPAHEHELRTNNIDNLSKRGDWTKVNPWRAPGTAGRGNPEFQPCGINSGSKVAFPNPPTTAKDVPKAGPGTALPSVGSTATWKAGSVVEAAWAIYANHGGGYSYRVCKKVDGETPMEECFQQTPLDFVGNTTEIRYVDGSRAPFKIDAVQTNVGTYPKGSMWRKNPIPMCNCDVGIACKQQDKKAVDAAAISHADAGGKVCAADPTCSHPKAALPGCKKCGDKSEPAWSCAADSCCPGYTEIAIDGGLYCKPGGPAPPAPPSPKPNPDHQTMYIPYSKTHFHKGQTSEICPTGVQFESKWGAGMGSSGGSTTKIRFGEFKFTMVDQLKVPAHLEAGEYVVSWRWDCEETPQVWNSCADITIV